MTSKDSTSKSEILAITAPILILSIGEKGGEGKSFFLSLLASYLMKLFLNRKIVLYDADRSNKSFKRYHGSIVKNIELTEDIDRNFSFEGIAESYADEKDSLVLVDTPANSQQALGHSISSGLGEVLESYGVVVVAFYISTADEGNLTQFVAVKQALKEIQSHILVKNLYGKSTKDDFDRLTSSLKALVSLKKRSSFGEIWLEELRKPEIDLVRGQKLTIDKAMEKASLVGKVRLKRYLENFSVQIESAFAQLKKN